MKLNYILEDNRVRRNIQKENLKIKISILLLLFVTLIMVSVIIFGNYFDIMNQAIILIDKVIATEYNSNDKAETEIQAQQNIKRILSDTQINTWTVNNKTNPKVSSLSDGNFVVIWQSNPQDGSNIYSIYGQIFYTNGAKKGNEFHVSNSTALNQTNPNIAAASSDKFMAI